MKVTNMICGCCTTAISEIPAEWETARRIRRGEVKLRRNPLNRCDDCVTHDVYKSPCIPAEFTRPGCDCGCRN